MSRRTNLIVIGWALFALLGSVYLLTYRGLFRSIDELALFCLTESLVQTHSVQTPQMGFARYHNRVSRLEPLYSLLATPLYWLAAQIGQLGNIQTTMLLNVLVTAMTGALLYALLLALDHPPKRAVWAALIYGLATLAWPYSRTFFREPLVALLLTAAALGFLRWRQTRHPGYAALMASCLVLTLVTKITAFLVWPAFGLAFVLETGVPRRVRLYRLLAILLCGMLGGSVFTVFYAMRMDTTFSGMLRFLGSFGTPGVVIARMFGLTLGAGRGLFVFCPVLLLAAPGLVVLWRRRRAVAALVVCATIGFLVGYGCYYDWHGGMAWGTRFLVPLVPLLVVPITEWMSLKGTWSHVVTGFLATVSTAIQFAASTVDYSLQVEAGAWENMVRYGESPVVQQLLLWEPAHFDMLWWHGPVSGHLKHIYFGWRIVVPLLLSLFGAGALLIARTRRSTVDVRLEPDRHSPGGRLWILSLLEGSVLVLGTWSLLLQAPAALPGYINVDPGELRQVARIVNRDRSDPHVIVTVSNDFHLNILLNEFKGRFVHYWVSPLQTDGFEILARPPFPVRSLRLIVDKVHMSSDQYGRHAEFWLNANLHRYFVEWLGSGYEVYSYLYPPDEMPLQQVNYVWAAGMAMSEYGMTPLVVAPGDPVWLEFHCSAAREPDADYDVFVQFLAPDGHYVNGTDGPTQFGARLTSDWRPGDTIVDRRAFFVPSNSPPGMYRVIAGFYRGGERQPVFDGLGRVLGTDIELGRVEVRR